MVFEVKQACLCYCALFLTPQTLPRPASEASRTDPLTQPHTIPSAQMNSNAQKQFYVRIRQWMCAANSDQCSSFRSLVNQELGSQTVTTSCSLFEPKLSS